MTQTEAAALLSIGRSYLSELEHGREPGLTLSLRFDRIEQLPDMQLERAIVNKSGYEGGSPRERLRSVLKEKKISAPQLAKKMGGYNAAIVENLVNGTGRMSEEMAAKIEEALDGAMSREELMGGSESPRIIDPGGIRGTAGAKPILQLPGGGRTRHVPLISWAAAGQLASATALDESFEHEGIASNVPGRAFAVSINGDSMYPEINPGDFAVVRADVEPRPGQVVLVRTIHGDVLCKRYSTRDQQRLVILSSVNKSYEPIEIPASEIAWIYPVKQVIRNY